MCFESYSCFKTRAADAKGVSFTHAAGIRRTGCPASQTLDGVQVPAVTPLVQGGSALLCTHRRGDVCLTLVPTCDKFTHQRFILAGEYSSWSPTRLRGISSSASSSQRRKTLKRSGPALHLSGKDWSENPDHGHKKDNADCILAISGFFLKTRIAFDAVALKR